MLKTYFRMKPVGASWCAATCTSITVSSPASFSFTWPPWFSATARNPPGSSPGTGLAFCSLRTEAEERRARGRRDAQHTIGGLQRLDTFQRNRQPEIAAEDQIAGFEQCRARRYFAAEADFTVSFLPH